MLTDDCTVSLETFDFVTSAGVMLTFLGIFLRESIFVCLEEIGNCSHDSLG